MFKFENDNHFIPCTSNHLIKQDLSISFYIVFKRSTELPALQKHAEKVTGDKC